MPLIDDRGRLFGRLNIVDAAVVVLVALLIPLAYAAYLLFRPAQARIVALEPSRVPVGTTEVTVRGEHLRPYLRIVVGTQGSQFLFAGTDGGVLRLPEKLEPGSYDVTLLDEAAELMRLPGALVVEVPRDPPSPPPNMRELTAVGRFAPADPTRPMAPFIDALRHIQGDESLEWGEVLGVHVPDMTGTYFPNLLVPLPDSRYVPRAVVRFRCALAQGGVAQGECAVENRPLVIGATIPLKFGTESATFRVEELHPLYSTTVEIALRCIFAPDELPLLDTWQRDAVDPPAFAALSPAIVSFQVVGDDVGPAQVIVMVKVRVPVIETSRGLIYKGNVIRIGGGFTVERPSSTVNGRVIRIDRVNSGGGGRR